LATLGVRYKQVSNLPAPNSWVYTGDLLRRVRADYGQSVWGERAFLERLNQADDESWDCEPDSEQFHAVIREGWQLLEQHPESPYRLDVQLAVAQAYETWWSLSLAPKGEEHSDVPAASYQEGGSEARQKAIAEYEELVRTASESNYAAYARRELPRLKLGIDTGQRHFYCTDSGLE
jgi:hypothetical protein